MFPKTSPACAHLPRSVKRIGSDLHPARIPRQADPMSLLRTVVSMMGCHDPHGESNDYDALLLKSKRLLARIPTAIGAIQRAGEQGSRRAAR
jgi:citrate synthase